LYSLGQSGGLLLLFTDILFRPLKILPEQENIDFVELKRNLQNDENQQAFLITRNYTNVISRPVPQFGQLITYLSTLSRKYKIALFV
jgi:hypothetical protein